MDDTQNDITQLTSLAVEHENIAATCRRAITVLQGIYEVALSAKDTALDSANTYIATLEQAMVDANVDIPPR